MEIDERHYLPLLEVLPDISVRFAVASFAADGGLTFGPAKVTLEGSSYRAVVDYVNVDAIPITFHVRKFVKTAGDSTVPRRLHDRIIPADTVVGFEAVIVEDPEDLDSEERQLLLNVEKYDEVTIPVYVGIGMRIAADIRAHKGGVALTSLANIAAAAQANALSGTLTVQTLGVTGRSVATALPLPSKLDQTTVENGILALGSSRALIYNTSAEAGDVTTSARVMGLYSPVGSDPALINAIYSALARTRPVFPRPCKKQDVADGQESTLD